MANTSRIPSFRNLTVQERIDAVAAETGISPERLEGLSAEAFPVAKAEHMSENVVGVFSLPVGVATNFIVNSREVLVPMATEEASVIAAASNGARMARELGGFTTSSTGPIMQAQIQLVDVRDPAAARLRILEQRQRIMDLAALQDPKLAEVGGGVRDLIVRVVPARYGTYVLVHLVVDVRDAMGANAVNTMAEAISATIAEVGGGRALLRILTNKADLRLARARATFDAAALGGSAVVDDMLHAYALAEADPYRAATHNKGIMNGVSAVVLATGNDTRAVEAGAHSHAVNAAGLYSSLSTFEKDGNGNLSATLEMPMPVGLVGGATKVHPAAQSALAIAEVTTASELAELIVAVGLAQNVAAMRVLATEGVQRGHMSLHAKTLAAAVGASAEEVPQVVAGLIEERVFRHDRAEAILSDIRRGAKA